MTPSASRASAVAWPRACVNTVWVSAGKAAWTAASRFSPTPLAKGLTIRIALTARGTVEHEADREEDEGGQHEQGGRTDASRRCDIYGKQLGEPSRDHRVDRPGPHAGRMTRAGHQQHQAADDEDGDRKLSVNDASSQTSAIRTASTSAKAIPTASRIRKPATAATTTRRRCVLASGRSTPVEVHHAEAMTTFAVSRTTRFWHVLEDGRVQCDMCRARVPTARRPARVLLRPGARGR